MKIRREYFYCAFLFVRGRRRHREFKDLRD
jgi:hypothetical protein